MTHTNNFQWIAPSRSGNRGAGNVKGARIAVYGNGKNTPQLSIVLYGDTMKQMRWVVGDRVEVGIDNCSGMLALRRVPQGGYALTALSIGKKDREKSLGTCVACVVKVTAPQDLNECFSKTPLAPNDCVDVDGVLILSAKS
jgi:hypothetical protein